MNRRLAILLVSGAVLLILAAIFFLSRSGGGGGAGESVLDAPVEASGEEPKRVATTLYFPGGGRALFAESRDLLEGSREQRARGILEALLAGPETKGLWRPLPESVSVGGIYFGDGGILFVDLLAKDQPAPPAQGSNQELLAVYSLVNSLALNLDECRGVAILWNGVQRPSFAGHVDTGRPLAANPRLVASKAS
ncbi:MAG: GerMN domain-containing protein [Acidobacteriota bacterium]